MSWDRNNPDMPLIDSEDESVTIAGHKFDVLGNPMNGKARELRDRIEPYCNLTNHKGATLEHDGYRWWFDSKAMLDKAQRIAPGLTREVSH